MIARSCQRGLSLDYVLDPIRKLASSYIWQVARVMKQTDESPRSDGDGIQLHRKDGGQAQDMSASEVSSTH